MARRRKSQALTTCRSAQHSSAQLQVPRDLHGARQRTVKLDEYVVHFVIMGWRQNITIIVLGMIAATALPPWFFTPGIFSFVILGFLLSKSTGLIEAARISWFFSFGFHLIGAALVNLVIILIFIIILMKEYFSRDKMGFYLMIPYLAWSSYALILNSSIFLLN